MVRRIYTPDYPQPQERNRKGVIGHPENDGYRTDSERGWFEWWYFDAALEDASIVVIVFSVKPFGQYAGLLNPGVSLAIYRPDGEKIKRVHRFSSAEFEATRERCYVRIGPNVVKGDLHNYEIHLDMGDINMSLTFHGLVPPWRAGSGRTCFGNLNQWLEWLPSVPHASVDGTWSLQGKTQTVHGTGYHDHNWGNADLHKELDYWYWGHGHAGEYTMIFVDQVAAARYGHVHVPAFMLAKGKQLLVGNGGQLIIRASRFTQNSQGCWYPCELDLAWTRDTDYVRMRLSEPRLLDEMGLVSHVPKWKKWFMSRFFDPYYLRVVGWLELEVNLGTARSTECGSALYEIMALGRAPQS